MRHPHELIGPHCDVYSLGKSIQNGTNLLDLHYQTFHLFKEKTRGYVEYDFSPRLDLVYTSELWNLVNRCQNEDPRYRPELHYLYNETKQHMEKFRTLAHAEEAAAWDKGIPGCFHSSVLFRKADRKRFETDPVFRSDYRKANLRPVWELLGPPPSQNPTQAGSSTPLRHDAFANAHPPNAAHVSIRTGRRRGGVPAHGEKEIEKKGKEKKKRAARVRRGIRGLLSKMNVFA